MARYRDRNMDDQGGRNDPLRPIFQQHQLENYGIWLELVPHQLKMIITDFGSGPAPRTGQFIRVKQFTYLDNMSLVKSERLNYPFGRKKMIAGLQVCLAMGREGFKARCFISAKYAYDDSQVKGIPKNSSIVIDIEVTGITEEPLNRQEMDDDFLINEITTLAQQADELVQKGDPINAQVRMQCAFGHIQSTRCKEIKNYLYGPIKQNVRNKQFQAQNMQRERKKLTKLFQIFDIIKIKTVELALLNRDYYRVIFLSKQCLMESRLELNERVLLARAKAFGCVGEFEQGMRLMQHLSDKRPENEEYREELRKIAQQKNIFKRQVGESMTEPVLALCSRKKGRKRKEDVIDKREEQG